ncbi:hypothetical protein [Algicella marina]|uniref:Uncharacterized protein n=1 Tax=Algicella marina TaxID=2683284 RepID=A0A6P1SUC9_9RHOB|nr:hypothetical protein [Algicella marina]QHQ34038.1 hypothetical protein GO499_01975 [Algicella marina]
MSASVVSGAAGRVVEVPLFHGFGAKFNPRRWDVVAWGGRGIAWAVAVTRVFGVI